MAELRRGSTGGEVKDMQRKLRTLGYDVGLPDGNFGARMERAVQSFQRAHAHAQASGVIDNHTRARIDQMAATVGG